MMFDEALIVTLVNIILYKIKYIYTLVIYKINLTLYISNCIQNKTYTFLIVYKVK